MKSLTTQFLMITSLFVLCISEPCYAQQVEVDRFFTPERTSWRINDTSNILSESFSQLGFFADEIWLCEGTSCIKCDNSVYMNWIISKFDASLCVSIPLPIPNPTICFSLSGYTIPLLRFGKLTLCVEGTEECFDSTLTKFNDNFAYLP